VVIAVMTVVNVLFITVVDRIKIVGTFMAYGMTRGRAVFTLAGEMLAFSAIACTLGILAALAASSWLSSLKLMADNSTLLVILGGKRSLSIMPSFAAAAITYAAGMLIPFSAALLAVGKMLKGEIVRLLYFVR
jgi:ABC-type antimicrobial peptide transport system permease subunit